MAATREFIEHQELRGNYPDPSDQVRVTIEFSKADGAPIATAISEGDVADVQDSVNDLLDMTRLAQAQTAAITGVA